jgi:hypothetical protein
MNKSRKTRAMQNHRDKHHTKTRGSKHPTQHRHGVTRKSHRG